MPKDDLVKLVEFLESIGCTIITFNYLEIDRVVELKIYYRPKEKS